MTPIINVMDGLASSAIPPKRSNLSIKHNLNVLLLENVDPQQGVLFKHNSNEILENILDK